jgi:lysophospholipid acyltransferase (LPLAT)-like uncharacterized protein
VTAHVAVVGARLRVTALSLAGWVLGALAWAWHRSLRVGVSADDALEAVSGRPWVLAFFHGTQFPLLAWRRRRKTVVLVSLSRDGVMQASALRSQGLSVTRGSTSRGGVRGLAALVRVMRRDRADAAFAVDGPRGPYGCVHGGAITAARATGAVVVPMGAATSAGIVLSRAWDRFLLPWPFARAHIVLGAPIDPCGHSESEVAAAVALAIASANERAAARLGEVHRGAPAGARSS